MYAAADEIRKKLLGRTREEIRLDAIKKQSYIDEKDVEVMVQNERRILSEVFSQHKVIIFRVHYSGLPVVYESKPS